jgi:hypothetical protein
VTNTNPVSSAAESVGKTSVALALAAWMLA